MDRSVRIVAGAGRGFDFAVSEVGSVDAVVVGVGEHKFGLSLRS